MKRAAIVFRIIIIKYSGGKIVILFSPSKAAQMFATPLLTALTGIAGGAAGAAAAGVPFAELVVVVVVTMPPPARSQEQGRDVVIR